MLPNELNEREIEIIGLLADGLANKEIANRLFLAPNTVKWYIKQLNSKLGTSNRDEIVQEAQIRNLLNKTSEAKAYERPKSNIPRQSTPFVGRDAELDELHAILDKPDLRLITILAQGGMGKTRLAIEAAEQQLGKFRDGVYFVGLQALGSFDEQLIAVLRQFITMLREGYSLIQCFQYLAENAPEPTGDASRQLLSDLKDGMELPAALDAMQERVRSNYFGRVVGAMQVQFREGGNLAERFDLLEAEFRKNLGDLRWSNKREYAEQLIIPAMAENLYFPFQGNECSQKDQLLNFLSNKELLLVTDNWEHLVDGAPLLNEILQAAPNVKILATSREKLRLLGETVYVLHGMQFPSWESPEDALGYDAVQLLLQTAQRVKPDWRITKENLDFVARVCRLTQGMPLGILLAISWLDMLSIEEIAEELATSAAFLEAQLADVPERQHSIRAIFNYAWNKLNPQEQDVFMKLSVFRGGFTREAAKEVAGANLQSVHRLMEKALLMRTGERYDLHELLRQFAEEKLKLSGEEDTVRDAHATHYLKFIAELNAHLKDSRQKQAVEAIIWSFENLRTAWFRALEQSHFEILLEALESLILYADYSHGLEEAYQWLLPVTEKLAAQGKNQSLSYGIFLIQQAHCEEEISTVSEQKLIAKRHCETALAIAEAHESQFGIYLCKRYLAQILTFLGEHQAAKQLAQDLLVHAQNMNEPHYHADAHHFMFYGMSHGADWDTGIEYIEKAYVLFKALGNRNRIAGQLHNLGIYHARNCHFEKAETYFKEAIHIRQELNFHGYLSISLKSLGDVLYEQARFEEAEELYQRAYHEVLDLNYEAGIATTQGALSRLAGAYGHYKEALELVRQLYKSIKLDKKHFDKGLMLAPLGMNGELDEMRAVLEDFLSDVPRYAFHILKTQFIFVFDIFALLRLDWGSARAAEILSLLVHHPRAPKVYRVHHFSQECREELESELGQKAFEAAWERGKALDLDVLCAEILAYYSKN
jgi:predicted ATPase/DNA-binding CsgD family transcriptional regulator